MQNTMVVGLGMEMAVFWEKKKLKRGKEKEKIEKIASPLYLGEKWISKFGGGGGWSKGTIKTRVFFSRKTIQLEAQKEKIKNQKTPSSRHSRFGGCFVLQNIKVRQGYIFSKPLHLIFVLPTQGYIYHTKFSGPAQWWGLGLIVSGSGPKFLPSSCPAHLCSLKWK